MHASHGRAVRVESADGPREGFGNTIPNPSDKMMGKIPENLLFSEMYQSLL